jgi:hypothetical protein
MSLLYEIVCKKCPQTHFSEHAASLTKNLTKEQQNQSYYKKS